MTPVPVRSRTPSTVLVALLVVAALGSISTAAASAASRHRAAARHHRVVTRCPGAHRPIAASPPAALRAAVVCLINQQRTERGLPALRANTDLDHSAQHWTHVMVTRHAFTHGANFAARITAAGFRWSQAGENIATGFATPSSVVRGWMASTDHCRNILDPNYRAVGTGVSPAAAIPSARGTWTQDFGLRMGQRPASHNVAPAAGCPYG